MDTSDGFSTGPRLSDAPQGDVARQAVAALRGYAFQLYGSVLAWLELKEGEDLFLEVAEDYAVVAQDALKAVQAKETRASGAVTLNTAGVKEAINSFVDLSHRNPMRTVSLRYFTTSLIGLEKEAADRIDGMSGLEYWASVARGADVAPLRARLLKLELKQETHSRTCFAIISSTPSSIASPTRPAGASSAGLGGSDIGPAEIALLRSVHAAGSPVLMSAIVSIPIATAFSPHRRNADQNAVRCAAEQKRLGEPPCRAGKGRPHQRHKLAGTLIRQTRWVDRALAPASRL